MRGLIRSFATLSRSILLDGQLPDHGFDPVKIQHHLNNLPYFVARTSLGKNLPVYPEYKSGGTKKLTVIRRIYGDAQALATELKEVLPGGAEVKVRSEMQQIVIKGQHMDLVRAFLTFKGF